MQAEHVSVYIARAPSDVYEFASDDAPVGGDRPQPHARRAARQGQRVRVHADPTPRDVGRAVSPKTGRLSSGICGR